MKVETYITNKHIIKQNTDKEIKITPGNKKKQFYQHNQFTITRLGRDKEIKITI